ncbi:MAG TPA: immunoglobulin domain-containing protein, partial [Verrucomicrobiae bacterium]|nr:immunoglobulin domain-containing protein [Verrucomicrobiae bacterium]
FEAIVRIDFDPAANLGPVAIGGNGRNTAMQIVSGEQEGTGGGIRSWQFRLDPIGFNPNAGGITTPLTVPTLEFINVNNGSAVQWLFAQLPTTGDDAIVQGNWYHVAATYDGNNNVADNFKIYWTRLDGTRLQATRLLSGQMTNDLAVGAVDFAIGNIGRNPPGNNFIGLIDEVRISSLARPADQMMFGLSAVPPVIITQPAAVFAAVGETVVFTAGASGSPPLNYQWQFNGGDILDQTNATLTLPNITEGDAGLYRLVVSNPFGTANSDEASLTVGIGLTELFSTGVDAAGALLPGESIDPHYELAVSADPDFAGPGAIVLMDAAPIPPYVANGPRSKWISPSSNVAGFLGNLPGVYVYRTSFIIDAADPSQTSIFGLWGSDNESLDIVLNGRSLGISRLITRAFDTLGPFTITNGFIGGSNTLDFVISNAPPTGPTAFRGELRGVGMPLAAGLPVVISQPASRTVRLGGIANMVVVALGAPPLSYQWYLDDNPIPGANSRVLTIAPVPAPDPEGRGNYRVVVTNPSGSISSQVATLTVSPGNQGPFPLPDAFVVAQDTPLIIPTSTLLRNDTDPDGDAIQVSSFDTFSLMGTLVTAGAKSTYTPPAGFTGEDVFSYVVTDSEGGLNTGDVTILVVAGPLPPVGTLRLTPIESGYQVEFNGTKGQTYSTQRATDLTAGNWAPIFTTNTPHGFIQFKDLNPPTPTGFYRTISP